VILFADEQLAALLHLRVTAQAKIRIGLKQHLLVVRAVRLMARDTAFAQRFVFEDESPRLFTMTFRTLFVETGHGEAARRFHDVESMRVVALHTVHFAFAHGVVLRKVELGVNFEVAGETRLGFATRIHNKSPATTTHCDVFAAGTVARFTARPALHLRCRDINARVRTGGKDSRVVRMTIGASRVADERRAGNFRWNDDGGFECGTGK
jgi:hypothetical protein